MTTKKKKVEKKTAKAEINDAKVDKKTAGDDDVPGGNDSNLDDSEELKYSFPTKSRCPRCQGTQTKAVSTQGNIQYRKCTAPVCQKAFTVKGKIV